MKTTLFDLWNGNLQPHKAPAEWSKETDEIIGFIENYTTKLYELLGKDGHAALENLHSNYSELRSLEREAAFVKGFSLAVRLLIESI